MTNYTIPRNNRELQRRSTLPSCTPIIPYQEIIGNYSPDFQAASAPVIIPYQEIIGNYSYERYVRKII